MPGCLPFPDQVRRGTHDATPSPSLEAPTPAQDGPAAGHGTLLHDLRRAERLWGPPTEPLKKPVGAAAAAASLPPRSGLPPVATLGRPGSAVASFLLSPAAAAGLDVIPWLGLGLELPGESSPAVAAAAAADGAN